VWPRVAVAVLGFSAVAVGGRAVRAESAAPTVRLVWFDPSDLASGTELVTRAEVASLFARMGAQVSWRRATSGEVTRSDEVWVNLLGAGPPTAGPLVLGATRERNRGALIVWVRLPNVRTAVGISSTGSPLGWSAVELRLFGVALGRVIAHEVMHALVPSLPHGTGLMSRSFDRRLLTAGSIPIEPEVALGLQAALRGDPVPTPSGGGVLTAGAAVREGER
jgi:hypothetical protein